MRLVERDEELGVLSDAFADCLEARGNVVLVSGAAASGKTALLHTFAEQVTETGAVFLDAAASRMEHTHPLGVISQLFSAIEWSAENAERATRLFAESAHSPVLPELSPEIAGSVRPHIPSELFQMFLELAEYKPVVVGVDDVRYVDPPSLEFLLYLIRRLRSTRILVVLTECFRPLRSNPHFYAELLSQPHSRHIRLNLLSECGVATVLAEALGPRVARDLASACYKVSGGNPLLVHAVIEDCGMSPTFVSAELALGDVFGQAVSSCLYRSGSEVLDLARALAVLGEHASPPEVAEILDLDIESAAQAGNVLDAVGLLDTGRISHEAVRLAVLATMLPDERAAMHGRAAHALRNHGAAATVVARHLIAADQVQAAWAVPILEQSAEEALLLDQVDLAIDHLRRACELSPDDQQRAAIKAALARAEWRVSPVAAARHLPELRAYALAGRLSWRQVAALTGYLLWHGEADAAIDTLAAVERRSDGLDAETSLGVDVVHAWLCFLFPELLNRLRRDRAVTAHEDLASVHGAEQWRSASVLTTVLTGRLDDEALIGADQVLQGPLRGDATVASMLTAIAALIYANKLDRATFWCDTLLKEAEERHAPTWQALFAAVRATIDVRLGRLAVAEESAQDALALISARGWGVVIGMPLAAATLATTAMGKYKAAATYLSVPVPDAMFRTPLGLHYLQARGRYYLATDRIPAALGDFRACGELMAKWGLDLPTLVPWRTDAARAFLAMGKSCQARDLANEQLLRLRPEHTRTRGITLRILAATGCPEDRPALLEEAMEALQSCGDRFELAITTAELSRTRRALGDDDRARALASSAHRLAVECGIGPDGNPPAELADVMPDAVYDSAGAGRIAELSDAERRVATLAAQGRTNRQIADSLFITVSTVEQHLTRVYRKLDVSRRTDLMAALRPPTAGASPDQVDDRAKPEGLSARRAVLMIRTGHGR